MHKQQVKTSNSLTANFIISRNSKQSIRNTVGSSLSEHIGTRGTRGYLDFWISEVRISDSYSTAINNINTVDWENFAVKNNFCS